MIKVKILIVDDEVDFCMLMQNYFEEKEFDVYVAHTLEDGFNLLRKIRPEIFFLDNNLPDGEGWSKVNEIIQLYPDLKINLISAYGDKPELLENSDNISFWEKPISTTELNAVF